MRFIFILFMVIVFARSDIYIASGAGYKTPINELVSIFQSNTSNKVNVMFGNMQQVISQVKMGDKFSVIIGDETFIKKTGISFSEKIFLGKGRLMLVYSKHFDGEYGVYYLDSANLVGMPNDKNAIYGIAAHEVLTNTDMLNKIRSKLRIVQTVPQVSAYLVNSDIDVGFINKTDYIKIKTKVSKAIEVDSSLYSPINIVAVVLSGKEDAKEVKEFIEFLKTDITQEILSKNGL